VFLSGRPLWVNPELNASNAFVAAWIPGSEGAGVADVLVGDAAGRPRADFQGRLPFRWPRSVTGSPFAGEATLALFPVGYGLSYARGGAVPRLEERLTGRTSPKRAGTGSRR
jgi:beta-glucosidase